MHYELARLTSAPRRRFLSLKGINAFSHAFLIIIFRRHCDAFRDSDGRVDEAPANIEDKCNESYCQGMLICSAVSSSTGN